jgi:phosphatidylglycerophosphate synthase
MLARLFRERYETFTRPLGRVLAGLGLSPDMMTYFSLFLSFVCAYILSQDAFGWGAVLVILVLVTDALDGAIARALGAGTRFGGVLDHVMDRYAEFFIMTGIMLSGHVAPLWVIFAASGMVMASYVRAKAESVGGLSSCTVGLGGRIEKLLLIIGGLFLVALGLPDVILMWTLIIVGVLSHVTAFQRLAYARGAIESLHSPGVRG